MGQLQTERVRVKIISLMQTRGKTEGKVEIKCLRGREVEEEKVGGCFQGTTQDGV